MELLLTFWCIAVVTGSLLLVGVPFHMLISGRNVLTEDDWMQAPFVGLFAVVLICQNLVYVGVTLRLSTVFLWLLVGGLWVWIALRTRFHIGFAHVPRTLFALAFAAYLAHGIGLLIVGASHYMASAWFDQLNYVSMTQFLMDYPFQTPVEAAQQTPYLAIALRYLRDRIGSSVLHGFFAVSAQSDARTLFEATILLSPALMTVAAAALGRELGMDRRGALMVSALVGLLPGVAMVHMESFQAQALAMPLLVLFPVLVVQAIRKPSRASVALAMLCIAAMAAVYTELFSVAIGALAVIVTISLIASPKRLPLLGMVFAVVVASFLLNPFYASSLSQIVFGRVLSAPRVLEHIYPWAYELSGLGRIWAGPALIEGDAGEWFAVWSALLTVMGYGGLIWLVVHGLLTVARHRTDADVWLNFGVRCTVLSIAIVPLLVLLIGDRPYQFYKLLLTVSPFLALGVAAPWIMSINEQQLWRGIGRFIFFGSTLTVAVHGTVAMMLQSAQPTPHSPRYSGWLHHSAPLQEVEAFLEQTRDRDVLIVEPDRYLNGWLAYFARHNRSWLVHKALSDGGLYGSLALPDRFASLGTDALIVSSPELAQRPGVDIVLANERFVVWKMQPTFGALLIDGESPYGVEQVEGKPFLWIGNDAAKITVLASQEGLLRIGGVFWPGPGFPDTAAQRLAVSSGAYQEEITLDPSAGIAVPVQAGVSIIQIRSVEAPTFHSADPRRLMVGVQELNVEPVAGAYLLSVNNPYGLEQLNRQPFFWIGNEPTRLTVFALCDGSLHIGGTFLPGPNLPEPSQPKLEVCNGSSCNSVTLDVSAPLVVPVRYGMSTITIRSVDTPTGINVNGDPRHLMVGVQSLEIGLIGSGPIAPVIVNPNGLEMVDERPFFWVGGAATTVTLYAAQDGTARLSAQLIQGPSVADLTGVRLRVTSDTGYEHVEYTSGGQLSLDIPVRAGRTTVTLSALDKPSTPNPNGDPRPLIIGVQGLQYETQPQACTPKVR